MRVAVGASGPERHPNLGEQGLINISLTAAREKSDQIKKPQPVYGRTPSDCAVCLYTFLREGTIPSGKLYFIAPALCAAGYGTA